MHASPVRDRRSLAIPGIAAILAVGAAALAPLPGVAQIIPIRTVPVASGDQFLVLPSARVGMGGVSMALHDTVGDPFTVPAAGARLRGVWVDVAPTLYVISAGNGSGRTLPLTVQGGGSSWFGGVSAALQEVRGGDWGWGGVPTLDEASAVNTFLAAYVGLRLGTSGWSLGAGASRAGLDALDGVDALYGQGNDLTQWGHVVGARVGAVRDWDDGRSLELVALYHELDMTHELSGWGWWFGVPDLAPGQTVPVRREQDETRTWGVAASWAQPVGPDGWRLGLTGTANRKSHPKIPNYDLMNIPRDPGDTWAGRLGAGLARVSGGSTLAMEVAVEPVATETWAVAAADIPRPGGGFVREGERTVDNDFAFFNSRVRLGGEHRGDGWGAQLGLEVYAVSYDLEQDDRVLGTTRDQRESWLEWTPTWGAWLGVGDLRLHYEGRLTAGTGRPGVGGRWGGAVAEDGTLSAGADFIPAPSGDLVLDGAWVLTQRVGVAVPVW